jgi:hypothetical protein
VQHLTDMDPMPFGKYRGTPMQDVPATYLHWLWTNERDPMRAKIKTDAVADYIAGNMRVLQQEYPDGIWK